MSGDLVRDLDHRVQVTTLLGGSADDLLQQHRQSDPATACGVERILHRDVVGHHHRLDAYSLLGGQLRGHLEIHDVAGVVLHDVQHSCAGIRADGGRQDLVWGGGGEHLTCAGRVQHPDPDETTVQRFVTGASPGNHRDLSGAGGFGPEDHAMGVIDTDVLVSGIHALEGLGQNVVGRIDQLLHGGAPAPLRSFIPDARAKLLVNQARSA